MKKVFLSFAVAIFVLTSFSASAEKVGVKLKGDTAQVVSGHDTLSVSSNVLKSIAARIDERLNDTLLSGGELVINDGDLDYGDGSQITDREFELEKERLVNRRLEQANVKTMVISVTTVILIGVVSIVLLSLLAYYMHRRAKYRIIEKAIENNYKLPDGVFGDKVVVRQQPIYVPETPMSQNNAKQKQTNETAFNQQQAFVSSAGENSLDSIMRLIKWNGTARSGAKFILVGICLIIFFLSVGAEPLAGISCIFLLLGGWKLFSAYYDSRMVNKYYNNESKQHDENAAQTPPIPQSPDTVTPPPFNGGNEDSQMK